MSRGEGEQTIILNLDPSIRRLVLDIRMGEVSTGNPLKPPRAVWTADKYSYTGAISRVHDEMPDTGIEALSRAVGRAELSIKHTLSGRVEDDLELMWDGLELKEAGRMLRREGDLDQDIEDKVRAEIKRILPSDSPEHEITRLTSKVSELLQVNTKSI